MQNLKKHKCTNKKKERRVIKKGRKRERKEKKNGKINKERSEIRGLI
jgi:hypothetical protein